MSHPAQWWQAMPDGRLQCQLCPRLCQLHDHQRGACFVRLREGQAMWLDSYGRSSGFCLDPIEKKPLNHFYPGSSVLSFGTAGCNLACKFCQNWETSKSRDQDRLSAQAAPADIARAAVQQGAASVAFTYNDPVIFAEYAIDTALACRAQGIHPVAVTAGYISERAREAFFAPMAAANVDLKSFSEDFYRQLCGAHLGPVLDTLRYLHHETSVWLEITTLLIPGANDSEGEIAALAEWVASELGPEVPLHFSAFHPDYRMQDRPATSPATLSRARALALQAGLHYVYTGNVHDREGGTSSCPHCAQPLIVRDWYRILRYELTADGRCPHCHTLIAGRFAASVGHFGARRIPLRIVPQVLPTSR